MKFASYLALSVAGALCLGGAVSPQAAAQSMQADTILTGGEIYTPDGWTEAMAIKDGVIIAVGATDDIRSHRSDSTEVIELDGATVLPGLHDMHVHPTGAGMAQQECRWPQGSPPEVVFDALRKCVAETPEGEWIEGGQWDAASFGDTPPHKSMLDKIAPNNPVALVAISGHSTWANSLALERAGITEDTPDPAGGVIERDADGEATGILRESAAGLVRREIPPPTLEERAAALEWALNKMVSFGITSVTDAGVSRPTMEAYAALADKGALTPRVRGCIMWQAEEEGSVIGDQESIRYRNLYARDRFSPDCIKVVLDGVPTAGHTAAMVEPYADADNSDGHRARGIVMVKDDLLNRAVTHFDAEGLTVKFHAAGDAAVRQALDAIEAAREANGFSGILHDSGHNSFVKMNDIRRADDIAATFEMSPYIWYPNPIIPDIAKAIGEERMKRWIPVKDAIDAGALVVAGSDWPVVPNVDPWLGMETLVTRRAPGNEGQALGAQEKISLEQAFKMYTTNGAVQMGHRDKLGTLKPGMLADMVVVDRNPFDIPIGEVHNTDVVMTIIDGEVVYRGDTE